MRKSALWAIPCAFFVVACLLNLSGKLFALPQLADTVKPSLLPLLSATTLAWLLGHGTRASRGVGLLVAAQLFGAAGDMLLLADGLPFFAGGMAAFLLGHVCYMCLFGGASWKGLSGWQWALSLVLMAGAVYGLVRLIGIEGVLFWPMLVYGFGLMMLIFSALAGVLRMPRRAAGAWWILLAGALLFTFSDAQIAMDTANVLPYAGRPFVIMLTYLAAQSLLAVGGIRLLEGK